MAKKKHKGFWPKDDEQAPVAPEQVDKILDSVQEKIADEPAQAIESHSREVLSRKIRSDKNDLKMHSKFHKFNKGND